MRASLLQTVVAHINAQIAKSTSRKNDGGRKEFYKNGGPSNVPRSQIFNRNAKYLRTRQMLRVTRP